MSEPFDESNEAHVHALVDEALNAAIALIHKRIEITEPEFSVAFFADGRTHRVLAEFILGEIYNRKIKANLKRGFDEIARETTSRSAPPADWQTRVFAAAGRPDFTPSTSISDDEVFYMRALAAGGQGLRASMEDLDCTLAPADVVAMCDDAIDGSPAARRRCIDALNAWRLRGLP